MRMLLLRIAPLVGWLALGLGLLLQAWVKDRVPGLALLFYAMPKPCLMVLALVLTVWPARRIGARWLAGGLGVGLCSWWLMASSEHGVTAPPGEGQVVRVLYWNLGRPTALHEDMVKMVKDLQPDFAAFVEPGREVAPLVEKYEALLPGYRAQFMPRGILWLAKVESPYRERGKLESIGAYARFEVSGFGRSFPVVVADVFPHPLHSRKNQLTEALQHTPEDPSAILLGDFNTPANSVHFAPYHRRFTDALAVAGSGLRETWPLGLPLLSLDYIWLGQDWQILEARKLHRWSSDHDALFVTLRRSN